MVRRYGVGLRALRPLESSDETVPASWHRFDEPRLIGGVTERVSQPIHDRVQTVLEIDERAVRPEPLTQLLTRDDVPRPLQQQREDLD
jgi:hypothetical protein